MLNNQRSRTRTFCFHLQGFHATAKAFPVKPEAKAKNECQEAIGCGSK
jgi:hypothetical protein